MNAQQCVAAILLVVVSMIGATTGCPEDTDPGLCDVLTGNGIDPRLDTSDILLTRASAGDEAVLVVGPGAAPIGTRFDAEGRTVLTDARGAVLRFGLGDSAQTAIAVTFDDGEVIEIVGTPLTAAEHAECAVGEATATGALPNDVLTTTCDGVDAALVVASADATLAPTNGTAGAFFPPTSGRGANPYAAAATTDGFAAVTLYGTDEVAWVDACSGRVLFRDVATTDADGLRATVPLAEPLTLRTPRDIDGDGQIEETLDEMPLLAPQGVAVREATGDVYVSFTNLIEPADNDAPQTIGPGVVARYVVVGDALTLTSWRTIPLQNPQALIVDGDVIVVAASGALGPFSTGYAPVTAAGLCLLPADVNDSAEVSCTSAPGAVVAEPTRIGDFYVTGDLLRAALHVFSAEDGTFIRTLPLTDDDGLDAVFAVQPLGNGVLGALHFNADELVFFTQAALDSTDEDLTKPVLRLPLRPEGTSLIRGPVALANTDDNVNVLFSVSAEIRKISLGLLWGLR